MARKNANQRDRTRTKEVRNDVEEFRRAHVRLLLRCGVLHFRDLHLHLRREGIESQSDEVTNAIIERYCGREGVDYDRGHDDGATEMKGILACAGIEGHDPEGQVRELLKLPWRAMMEPVVSALARLERHAYHCGLSDDAATLFHVRTRIAGTGPGLIGQVGRRPTVDSLERLQDAHVISARILDAQEAEKPAAQKGDKQARVAEVIAGLVARRVHDATKEDVAREAGCNPRTVQRSPAWRQYDGARPTVQVVADVDSARGAESRATGGGKRSIGQRQAAAENVRQEGDMSPRRIPRERRSQ
jgi:hypothetical protein